MEKAAWPSKARGLCKATMAPRARRAKEKENEKAGARAGTAAKKAMSIGRAPLQGPISHASRSERRPRCTQATGMPEVARDRRRDRDARDRTGDWTLGPCDWLTFGSRAFGWRGRAAYWHGSSATQQRYQGCSLIQGCWRACSAPMCGPGPNGHAVASSFFGRCP